MQPLCALLLLLLPRHTIPFISRPQNHPFTITITNTNFKPLQMTMHDFDPNSNSSLSPIPPVRTWSSLAQSRALSLHTKLISAPSSLYSPYSKALAHLGSAIRLYGPENIYVSYNGGKDAVVVEVLYRLALAVHNNKHENSDSKTTPPPLSIFFDDPQDFTQIKSFVSSTSTYHDLSLIRLLNCDFKSGLSSIINSSSEGGGRNLAFVLGTRNSDPNGANQVRQMWFWTVPEKEKKTIARPILRCSIT